MRSRLTRAMFLLGGLLALFLIACGPAVPPDATPTADEADPAAEAPAAEASAETAVDVPVEAPTTAPAAPAQMPVEGETITTPSGLQVELIRAGDGPALEQGQLVEVHYVGSLEDGTVFDSSRDRDETFVFPLGVSGIIPGWNEGVSLLRVGDEARLILPPELAYGSQGATDPTGAVVIPPDATITFDVEVISIKPGPPEAPTAVDEADYTVTDSGLKYYDFVVGEGPMPELGQIVSVDYTGWLTDGTLFDSSLNRGQPFAFPLGQGAVIPGWDEGLATMQVGGKRQLVVPPELGYGDQGAGGIIPPGATLIFEVELVEIQ